MPEPAPLGPSHASVNARRIPFATKLIAPPRRAGHSFTGGWMAYRRPARQRHNTRAYNSILLERPLTKGEMRANVLWRARRWAGVMGLYCTFLLVLIAVAHGASHESRASAFVATGLRQLFRG